MRKFGKQPGVVVRYFCSEPTSVVVLTADSIGFIVKDPTAELEASPALQFGNPSLIRLLQEYFEYTWSTVDEEKMKPTASQQLAS